MGTEIRLTFRIDLIHTHHSIKTEDGRNMKRKEAISDLYNWHYIVWPALIMTVFVREVLIEPIPWCDCIKMGLGISSVSWLLVWLLIKVTFVES